MSLIVVRHGATQFNSESRTERLRGHLDVPLTSEGLQQAQQIARTIAKRFPVSQIITSDLGRAVNTAVEIARQTGAPVATTRALRPWNCGHLQGKYVHEILPVMHRLIDRPHEVPSGGESYWQFLERFIPFIRAQVKAHEGEREATVLVTHTRNLQALRAWLEEGRPATNRVDLTVAKHRSGVGTGQAVILDNTGLRDLPIKHYITEYRERVARVNHRS